jgi:L-asparaginase
VDPLSVAVERGGVVESRHRVHAVKVRDGEVVEAHGDPNLVTFVRSAAKPLQALLLVREYADLADEEIAIACASHGARSEQLDAVKALLARAWAAEDELECGPVDGSRLRHNCSGKHAGMLAVCAARDWPREGYRLRDHPLQQAVVDEVAGIADVHASELPLAVDGCGVVTFALSLERMAAVFAGFARGEPEGAARIVSAMTSNAELVEGPSWPATEVMLALPGAVAKHGAEGVLCVGLPDGAGIALKVEDGATRAILPAAAEFLGLSALAEKPIENSRGDEVGRIRSGGSSAKNPVL